MDIHSFDSLTAEIYQPQNVDETLSSLISYLDNHTDLLQTDEGFHHILASCHKINEQFPDNEKVQRLWVHALQARGLSKHQGLSQLLDTFDKKTLSARQKKVIKQAAKKEFDTGVEHWLNDPEVTGNKKDAVIRIKEAYEYKNICLDLSHLDLSSLPKEIGYLESLTKLMVARNKLTSLPPEIRNLQSLEVLTASYNCLTSLPPEIKNLQALIALDISNNPDPSQAYLISNHLDLLNPELFIKQGISLPPEIGGLQNLQVLNASNSQLTSIPPEIGNLHQLNELNLSCNRIAELPPEIGKLHKLEELDLSCNQLNSLPPEIGNLQSLRELNVRYNPYPSKIVQKAKYLHLIDQNARSDPYPLLPPEKWDNLFLIDPEFFSEGSPLLPPQIGNLQNLVKLYASHSRSPCVPPQIGNCRNLRLLVLDFNRLTSLPPQIGNLGNLTMLSVIGNQLTSVPTTIGNLFNLRIFHFDRNPSLQTLPMSIGNMPEILQLNNAGTGVSQETIDLLMNLSRAMRSEFALEVLPKRLDVWQQHAKANYDLAFITQLEKTKQQSINEWLLRLSKTYDFSHHQHSLANIVCSLLETLKTNKDFSDLFFTQIDANLECCQDRAAMSLNEIFTSWKLYSMDNDAPLGEKLALLAGIAKTNVLRKELAKVINKGYLAQKEGQTTEAIPQEHIEQESVEIYLYYETLLQNELGLVTAIKNMNYERMGQRSWIDPEKLIEAVNNNYLEEMIQLNAFKRFIQEETSHQTVIAQVETFYEEKNNNLDLYAEDYGRRVQILGIEREEALNQCTIQWVKQNLPKDSRKRRVGGSLPDNKKFHYSP